MCRSKASPSDIWLLFLSDEATLNQSEQEARCSELRREYERELQRCAQAESLCEAEGSALRELKLGLTVPPKPNLVGRGRD